MPKQKRTKKSLAIRFALLFIVGIIGGKLLFGSTINRALCIHAIEYPFPLAMQMYASDHPEELFPPMSHKPGRLFVEYEHVMGYGVGEDSGPFFCPAMPRSYKKLSLAEQFEQPTYIYTGYVLENEEQFLAFLDEYPKFLEMKVDFNEDLPAPKGLGSFGGDSFIRLSLKIKNEQFDKMKDDENYISTIPLFIELPTYTEDGLVFRHKDEGGFVKYWCRGIDWEPYDEQFPMTPAILQKIGELKQHSKSHAQ